MSQPSEVAYDDLEYTPDGVFLLDGCPFSGTTTDRDANGRLIAEVVFVNGREHGIARTWYPDGTLSGECPYIDGVEHGVEREWHEDGSLRCEKMMEFGVLMKQTAFDSAGHKIECYERSESDALYQVVLKHRAQARRTDT